jgi:hypothetical protein
MDDQIKMNLIIKLIEEMGGTDTLSEVTEKQMIPLIDLEKIVIKTAGEDYNRSRSLAECLAAASVLKGLPKESLYIMACTRYFEAVLDRAAADIEKERLEKIWESMSH